MKPPLPIVLCFAILLAACASSEPALPGGGDGGDGDAVVPEVTNHAYRVEWRSLKDRRTGEVFGHAANAKEKPLGLINKSSPETSRLLQPEYENVKPVADQVMAVLVQQLRDLGFFEHARKGPALDSFGVGDGIGVVHVRMDDENWALLLPRGAGGTELPEVYRDCRYAIIQVHMHTTWLRPTTVDDPDRVFRMPVRRPPRR